jgi:hypothetical protein
MASDGGTAMAPTLTTAAADYTGASGNNAVCFTAGSNGSRVVGLKFTALGTNTQSVARVYVNNGSSNTTAGNNTLVGSLTLPGTTASNTVAEASAAYYFENGALDLEAGWKIYVGLATTVSAGWRVSVIGGGDY